MKLSCSIFILLLLAASSLFGSQISSKQWDDLESKKLYEKAVSNEKKGDIKKAIQDFSEILEFFPDGSSWHNACLHLSNIYLLQKNTTASEDILYRLFQNLPEDPSLFEKILTAKWDFYDKQEKYPDLFKWLNSLNPKERLLLKNSQDIQDRIYKIAKSKNQNIQSLLGIYKTLDYQEPISEILNLIEHEGFLFSQEHQALLLKLSIQEPNPQLIGRATRSMIQSGWHKKVHEVFYKHRKHAKADRWMTTWMNTLIDGKLWVEADTLLQSINPEKYVKESYLIMTGLEKWTEAFQLLKKTDSWIYSTLSFEDLNLLLHGLYREKHSRAMALNLVDLLPKGGKQTLLKAEIESDLKKKEILYQWVIKNDSIYTEQAYLSLAKIFFKQRNLDPLRKILKKNEKTFPNSKTTQEIAQLHHTLSTILLPIP